MSDFKYFMKDSVHDLFSYLKSPYFDYKDYRDNSQYDCCNDFHVDDYHVCEHDCDLFDIFSNIPIETHIEDIRNEYFRNKDNDHYEDFTKETNIHFLNKLKLHSTFLDVLFDDKKFNIDSHFVSRLLTPNLKFDNSIQSIKEMLTILIKLILSNKIIHYQ